MKKQKTNKKRILLKATNIIPYRNGMLDGVGRSTIELLKNMMVLNSDDLEFQIYCTGLKSLFFDFYHWRIKHHRLLFSLRGSSWLSSVLEPLVRKLFWSYDLFHITNNFDSVYDGENFIVTIHDLILYRENVDLRPSFERVAKKSKAIVTCSNFSKKEIVDLLHVSPEKIYVIPWGINHSVFFERSNDDIAKVKGKFKIETPYFFSCSCGSKRKNPDVTMQAFVDFLKSENHATLVLVWGNCSSELKEEYSKYIESGQIKILNGVSNEDLAALYSGALASYFISSAEGFGFPLLESFACGTPCVTCNNTSLTELGKGYAYYVKDRNVRETEESMEYFYHNGKGNVDTLVDYAKKFNWADTAKQYVDLYRNVLN